MGKHKKDKKDKKHKKDKKRKRNSERDTARAVEELRKKRKLERMAAKDRIKATETEEERNTRRLAKKRIKAQRTEEDKSLFGYTNEDNPFRDPNLTQQFVWKKKLDVTGKRPDRQNIREKQVELKQEIEAVKARREQRDIENLQMEEMKAQMQRDQDAEEHAGWEEREEQFHHLQASRRSAIRIAEGREQAIDILAKNLNIFQSEEAPDANIPVDLDVELTEPHQVFEGLEMEDLTTLKDDLQQRINAGNDLRYWNSLMTICNDEVAKMQENMQSSGIHSSVRQEVLSMFDEAQSEKELETIGRAIQTKISKGGRGVDIPYWETVYRQLVVFQSKAFLKRFHEELLQKRLTQLKESYFREEAEKKEAGRDRDSDEDEDVEPELVPKAEWEGEVTQMGPPSSSAYSYADMDLSPVLHSFDEEDEDGLPIEDPDIDYKNLEMQRRIILEQKDLEEKAGQMDVMRQQEDEQARPENVLAAAGISRFMKSGDEMYAREASKGLAADEEKMGEEVDMDAKTYWWHDKYRPRKPKYFNRVKTGYDWNRYNQTHYDKENPPPKVVQGYKFNVFYPDLIDPTDPPTYTRERIPGDDDYEIMRFSAGAPYEDIAFKIVKREWELSHRRGYKNTFDRGVLHLYFNFRRYFYRR